jgi:hypothetical protein
MKRLVGFDSPYRHHFYSFGDVSEWPMVAALKTADSKGSESSNLSVAANLNAVVVQMF